ncbi:MAG: hypothetical protein PHI35_00485 [Victivallaceae bacterium]|nr:hypothetical protein [Victivallaceae bacterium]
MDFHLFAVSAASAAVIIGLGAGCSQADVQDAMARSEARREARVAAFDPLRPDPQYRLLPDRPRRATLPRTAPDVPVKLVEPPAIWEDASVDAAGLKFTTSKINGNNFQIYMVASKPFSGKLRAIAKNASFSEIARATASAAFEPDDAGYVEFQMPNSMADDEIKLIILEVAK